MITVGADVEVVLRDKGNNLVSSIGLIGGDKHFPFVVPNGNLQEDNVLAEFAIDPVEDKVSFVNNISSVLNSLKAKIEPMKLGYHVEASAVFPKEQLQHPLAQQFGCEPDFNAWTGKQNPRPLPSKVGDLRTCGGHIHVGFEFDPEADPKAQAELIQWMDVYLGLASVVLDEDTERRKVYGKAGAFRPKEYGVEYRVLSNFWIKSKELTEYVYDQTYLAYERYLNEKMIDRLGMRDQQAMAGCINSGDASAARMYMSYFGVRLP